jgi:hypothetical protein
MSKSGWIQCFAVAIVAGSRLAANTITKKVFFQSGGNSMIRHFFANLILSTGAFAQTSAPAELKP